MTSDRTPAFLFRVDVSPETGTGHLRRCSTLARELRSRGARAVFACRASDVDLDRELAGVADSWCALASSRSQEEDAAEVGRLAVELETAAAIVDFYGAGPRFQHGLLAAGVPWLQFDGAACHPFWARWLVNAGPMADASVYEGLRRRQETRFLLGPSYALLRQEFIDHRGPASAKEHVARVLLTFGGGDDRGATIFFLDGLRPLSPNVERLVLASSHNPRLPQIREWVAIQGGGSARLLVDEHQVARCMAMSDLAITAGGTTTFETAAMGLPSAIVQIADNQARYARAWEHAGTAIDLGRLDGLTPGIALSKIEELLDNLQERLSMAQAGIATVDGGGAARVASILLEDLAQRLPAKN